MVEYIAIALSLVALVSLTIALNPKTMFSVSVNALINFLIENEGQVVMALYNTLPTSVKGKVDSKTVAQITGHVIIILIDVLEDAIAKKEKK